MKNKDTFLKIKNSCEEENRNQRQAKLKKIGNSNIQKMKSNFFGTVSVIAFISFKDFSLTPPKKKEKNEQK